ncbi:MAG TPA: hypothetical protein VG603_05350 [Chitinophagales bacterium]|nr:hypothetical protein [Chitinophagales bacterium]
MNYKKLLICLAFIMAGIASASAQKLVFANDVDQHDGKCKPKQESTTWKLNNGQVSFFALIIFTDPPKYKKILIHVYRNGDTTKPVFEDEIISYKPGDTCVRNNLVMTKKGEYQVKITDDDGNTITEGAFTIGK